MALDLNSIVNGEPITMYGNGLMKQLLDFGTVTF